MPRRWPIAALLSLCCGVCPGTVAAFQSPVVSTTELKPPTTRGPRAPRLLRRGIARDPCPAARNSRGVGSLYSSAVNDDDSVTPSPPPPVLSTTTTTINENDDEPLDADAVIKYGAAVCVQMGLGAAFLAGLDALVTACEWKIPVAANVVLFYIVALKSRACNPLSNARPQPNTLESTPTIPAATVAHKRNMPRWTPPGLVFPIVWLLIIGPLRAATSAMVYQAVGRYASLPILSLLLHLSVGDVWNTINNVERRYGVAVTGVALVWLSKAHAAYQYSRVHAVAGRLLGATLVWLTIAAALVTATWRLNPDPATGKPERLYPVRGKGQTKFVWFAGRK